MNLSDFREDYRHDSLDRAQLDANPFAQFESWFSQATGGKSRSRWQKISASHVLRVEQFSNAEVSQYR